jgi:pyruvate/2-oxoglutarate dehydrogenase complex dihydrolipoamide acyltransferase (E2) component
MPTPIHTPRINNNDDQVRLVELFVETGSKVSEGMKLAEIETDKAAFTIEAEASGYILQLCAAVDDLLDVGSVLFWLGSDPNEPVPAASVSSDATQQKDGQPTTKALDLLQRYGLHASSVPASGARLSAADVEAYVKAHKITEPAGQSGHTDSALAPGRRVPLSPKERAMLRSVLWHRDESVPGYLELHFNVDAWSAFAGHIQSEHRLLLSPLLGLMSHQLVRYAATHPVINATLDGSSRYEYQGVHLGFTIQSGSALYMATIHDAEKLGPLDFVRTLTDLQRSAMADRLRPEQVQGASLAFTSMERWKLTRHIPVLPPFVSLIVAHTVDHNRIGTLGATYDHRIMTGGDAAQAISHLLEPEDLP